jgi:hypothetical protein
LSRSRRPEPLLPSPASEIPPELVNISPSVGLVPGLTAGLISSGATALRASRADSSPRAPPPTGRKALEDKKVYLDSRGPTTPDTNPVSSAARSASITSSELCPSPLSHHGIIHSSVDCRGEVVVVSEAWPIWLFVLPGLRLRCDIVIITTPTPSWLPVLQQLCPAVRFYTGKQPLASFPLAHCVSLLAHGSVEWYMEHSPSWPPLPYIMSFLTAESPTALA